MADVNGERKSRGTLMTDDSFYNTINLAAKELNEAEQKALNQEQRVLRFFIEHGKDRAFGPAFVRAMIFGTNTPLTSVRRAMTSLTNRGDLVKLEVMEMGDYGKPEHLWTVAAKWDATKPHQGELL